MTRDEYVAELKRLMKKHTAQHAQHAQQKYPTLDRYAREYIAAMVPADASDYQRAETIIAFKAGAMAGFETLYNAFEPLKGMEKDSDAYNAKYEEICAHLRRWSNDISKVAATLLKKRIERVTDAEVHIVHISEAVEAILVQLGISAEDVERMLRDDDNDDDDEPQHEDRKDKKK